MRTVLSAAAVIAATLTAANAHALISAGVLVGNGFKDGYNFGAGARAGLTLPGVPLYVGGAFIYHTGKSDRKILYAGAEGGWEFGLPLFTIRPFVGLGYASLSGSTGEISSSNGKFVVWPGVAGLLSLGIIFLGIDGRYVVVTDSDNSSAFSLFATGGLSF